MWIKKKHMTENWLPIDFMYLITNVTFWCHNGKYNIKSKLQGARITPSSSPLTLLLPTVANTRGSPSLLCQLNWTPNRGCPWSSWNKDTHGGGGLYTHASFYAFFLRYILWSFQWLASLACNIAIWQEKRYIKSDIICKTKKIRTSNQNHNMEIINTQYLHQCYW